MLPQPLIEQYWHEVEQLLQDKHGLSAEKSSKAATAYRNEAEPKTGEMLYHQDATIVASTIAAGVRNGALLAG
jgi:hypothetical protein